MRRTQNNRSNHRGQGNDHPNRPINQHQNTTTTAGGERNQNARGIGNNSGKGSNSAVYMLVRASAPTAGVVSGPFYNLVKTGNGQDTPTGSTQPGSNTEAHGAPPSSGGNHTGAHAQGFHQA